VDEKDYKMKIITTFSNKYWRRTGQYTVTEWKKLMPSDWQLWIHDTPTDLPINYDVSVNCPNKNTWIMEAEKIAKQKIAPMGYYSEWSKLCHKSFAQWECYEKDPTGIMIWMDADIKFRKPLDSDVFKNLVKNKFCAYLGRDRVDTKKSIYVESYGQYEFLSPETGIIIYNCDHYISKDFFKNMKNIYLSMEVFNLYDWSDTGVFYTCVKQFNKEYFNDITENLPAIPSPLTISVLDEYLEHWMGTANKKNKKDITGLNEKQALKNQGLIL
jgi:hypothetical protein